MWECKLELNKIHNMDCLIGLRQMPDKCVDIVVTSPFYNLGHSCRGGEMVNMYEGFDDNMTQEEYYKFISDTLKELIRVTRGYVFFNFQMLTNNKLAYLRILGDFRENIKDIIIWHKKQWEPSIQPTCLSSAFEYIVVFTSKEQAQKRSFERAFFNNRISGQQTSNVIHGDSASRKELNSEQGSNKAVFPQYFVRWFIDKFTEKGDIVLEPFAGSGTTCLVAQQSQRNFIGFEINSEYCDVGNNRLKQKSLNTLLKENNLTDFAKKEVDQYEKMPGQNK